MQAGEACPNCSSGSFAQRLACGKHFNGTEEPAKEIERIHKPFVVAASSISARPHASLFYTADTRTHRRSFRQIASANLEIVQSTHGASPLTQLLPMDRRMAKALELISESAHMGKHFQGRVPMDWQFAWRLAYPILRIIGICCAPNATEMAGGQVLLHLPAVSPVSPCGGNRKSHSISINCQHQSNFRQSCSLFSPVLRFVFFT